MRARPLTLAFALALVLVATDTSLVHGEDSTTGEIDCDAKNKSALEEIGCDQVPALKRQPAKDIPDYYSVQTSPAFTVLGFSSEQVIRPTTPKQLALALLNGKDDADNPHTGVAVEIAPFLLFSTGREDGPLSIENYQTKENWLRRIAARTLLSFAFTRGTSPDDPSLRLAVGLRTTLLDKGDPRYSAKLDSAAGMISNSPNRLLLLARQNEILDQKERVPKCVASAHAVRRLTPGSVSRFGVQDLELLVGEDCWQLVVRFVLDSLPKGTTITSYNALTQALTNLAGGGLSLVDPQSPCQAIGLDTDPCVTFFQDQLFDDDPDTDQRIKAYQEEASGAIQVEEKALSEQVKKALLGEWEKAIKKAQEDNWNATNITIGAALTSADTSGDLGAVKNTGIAVYGTAAWGFEGMGVLKDRAHLIGHIRYNTDQFVGPALMELADAFPDDDEMDDMMAGMGDMDGMNGMDTMDEMPMTRNLLFLGGQLRLAGLSFNSDLPGPDIFLFGEGAYKRSRFADGMLDKTFRYAFGLDVRIIKGVSFQLAIGDETGSEFMRKSTFVLGDIKYSF